MRILNNLLLAYEEIHRIEQHNCEFTCLPIA